MEFVNTEIGLLYPYSIYRLYFSQCLERTLPVLLNKLRKITRKYCFDYANKLLQNF